MYESLGRLRLKSGEAVEAGVVKGPDPEWADRVETLLGHKGEAWRWGNRVVLREEVGLEAYFYLLHRDGAPFANMMNIELNGVGIFGHVFTRPEDRRQGAASGLMDRLMDHFRARGGRALYLGTGFDSPPYHIYRAHGFEGVEPRSGSMAYYATSQAAFDAAYFAPGPVRVESADWVHWPASPALFLGDFPGVIRCAPLRLFGRSSTEGPLLPLLRKELGRRSEGKPAQATALRQTETSAVVGLAVWDSDPLWPRTCLVDVYCHPGFWDRSGELLGALALPGAERCLAYCDADCLQKADALAEAGFRPTVTYERRVAADRARTRGVDVTVWER